MQDTKFLSESSENRGFQEWLFNPFDAVRPGVSLLLGLGAIALTALAFSLTRFHLISVVEVSLVDSNTESWLHYGLGLSAWICMVMSLHVAGALAAPNRYKLLDLAGHQALARWPFVFVAIVCQAPAVARAALWWRQRNMAEQTVTLRSVEIVVAIAAVVIYLLAIVWSLLLMYRGFVAVTNIQKPRAVIFFGISLIVAVVLSVVAFFVLGVQAGLSPGMAPPQ